MITKRAETFADIDMVFGFKIQFARFADTPHLDVGISIAPARHAGMRNIGHVHQEIAELMLNGFQTLLQRLQLFGLGVDFGHQRRCIFFLCLELTDLLGQRVAACLQILSFGLDRLAFVLKCGELRHIEHITAIRKTRSNRRRIRPQ
jgi:hypothetical protein